MTTQSSGFVSSLFNNKQIIFMNSQVRSTLVKAPEVIAVSRQIHTPLLFSGANRWNESTPRSIIVPRSLLVFGNQPLRLHFPSSAALKSSRRLPNASTLRQDGLSRGSESRGTMLPDADETRFPPDRPDLFLLDPGDRAEFLRDVREISLSDIQPVLVAVVLDSSRFYLIRHGSISCHREMRFWMDAGSYSSLRFLLFETRLSCSGNFNLMSW